jgi:hypothetical protein
MLRSVSPASLSGRFISEERARRTHWIGSWVVPETGMDKMEKWKRLTLHGLRLRPSVVQPLASPYTDSATTAHIR